MSKEWEFELELVDSSSVSTVAASKRLRVSIVVVKKTDTSRKKTTSTPSRFLLFFLFSFISFSVGGRRRQAMEHSADAPRPPSGRGSSCLSDQQRGATLFGEKEHMFDKVVTPSDVGKLNRLVIPKQHAEKHFPVDTSSGDKGLLLSFEDRTGKSWRFRYSYWNSSQSYVMTKGWSRFVKEKRLDAGDTVSFWRGVGEAGRDCLFIDWKRRQDALGLSRLPRLTLPSHNYHHHHRHHQHLEMSSMVPFAHPGAQWGRLIWPPTASAAVGYGYNDTAASNPYLYLRSAGCPLQVAVQLGVGGGGGSGGNGELGMPIDLDPLPAVEGSAVAKRVRLFGVNLDCPATEDDPEGVSVGHGQPRPPVLLPPGASEMVESPRKDKDKLSLFLDLM